MDALAGGESEEEEIVADLGEDEPETEDEE
jgi:hypothetical protein